MKFNPFELPAKPETCLLERGLVSRPVRQVLAPSRAFAVRSPSLKPTLVR